MHAGKAKFSRDDIIRERWFRGRLGYKLHEGQRKIEEYVSRSKNQLFVGEIARQFGKSFWLVIQALECAIKTPKGRIKYGTAFQTDLLEFILPTFDMVLEDCPEDLRPVWKVQQSKWVFSNGAEIKLVGLDRKPNGLRGNKIDLIILDEAGFMSGLDYLYKSVIIPATTHRPNCRILVFSTPPATPAHEFLDYVQKAEYEGGYLLLTIFHNPLLSAETIFRLMKETGCKPPEALSDAECIAIVQRMMDTKSLEFPTDWEISTTFQREYLCKHITDANLQVIAEWKDEFVQDRERDQYFKYYQKYEAMDLGVGHLTVNLYGYYDFLKAQLVIEDEVAMSGPTLTTAKLKEACLKKEIDLGYDKPRRFADNNNPLLLQDLSLIHGMHFSATDKGTLAEMVNTVKIMVQNGRIVVHPRCKQLKGSLKYGVWDKHRKKFEESKVYGHFDALAALIYLVRNLDQVTNPIPVEHQFTSQNDQILFVRKQSSDSSAAHNLRQSFRGRR